MNITHDEQQEIWDKEHGKPQVLLQMDSTEASSGIFKFYDFLSAHQLSTGKGIELGCGKGRNVIGLAEKGYEMTGFDFSPAATEEAKKRSETLGEKVHFLVMDATEKWDFEDNTFDFGIDCFATTDIESLEGRKFAAQEMYRVVRQGGYLLAYLLSTDDEFHLDMIQDSPAAERNAFHHPTGKFEKVFDEKDIEDLYGSTGFTVVEHQRVPKKATFNGKEYQCNHHWLVLQK